MKKIIIFIIAGIIGLFFSVQSTQALIPLDPGVLLKYHKFICEDRPAQVEKIKNKFADVKDDQSEHLDALKSKFEALIKKLDAKGYSVGQLETDLQNLNGKIDKFGSDYEKLTTCADEAKDYSCNKTAEYKNKVTECRDILKTVRGDVQDVVNYYKADIRDDIKAMKKQNPAQ